MRRPIPSLLATLAIAWSTSLQAQVPDWVTQILTAAQLPIATTEARREGIASEEIRAVLEAMGRSGIPAYEATLVIDTARVLRREHGPMDNFGAFVQSQLAAGKRGRDLAAAIRAEHARQGRGRGAGRGGQDQSRATNDSARGRGTGRPDAARGRGRGNPPPTAEHAPAPDPMTSDPGRRPGDPAPLQH